MAGNAKGPPSGGPFLFLSLENLNPVARLPGRRHGWVALRCVAVVCHSFDVEDSSFPRGKVAIRREPGFRY